VRTTFYLAALLLAPLAGIGAAETAQKRGQPNVVLFLVDDLGYGDLACHGNPHVKTPQIDAFAGQATELTQFHVSPVCSPTRASLMTGRYNFRTGVADVYGKATNLVFCGQRGQIDYYQRYQEIPETVDYEPNWQCGSKAYGSVKFGGMSVDYPDTMQIENARYTAWFKKSEGMLPAYHWDYTQPWNYLDWGNTQLPRYAGSRNLRYDTDDRYAVTPLSTDTRKMKVSQNVSENAGGLEIVVTLETPEAVKALPLALWDIPREWKAGEGWWTVKGANRFVPIRAPYTGNLNGILEVDAKPGKNEYRLTIATPKRVPQTQDILLETVHAKVFSRDGQTMAYIWPMQPWETAFELDVPAGKSVQYYAAPKGERVDLPPGKHRLTINKESWARIVGLDPETLKFALRESK
jgi:hypothetical protein